ncbi:MAG: MASE1 domain-containing protein [Nitrospira sp.]|nr:MASE1 domain-containing protein [Nitrospira sp.]
MTETRSTDGWLRWLALVVALAALYVVTTRLGLMLALPPEHKATAVWPPSGIALAALLLFGHRIWLGIWLGAFLANFWDGFTAANPFPLSAHLFVLGGIATGSTLQALAGSFLIRRWTGSVRPFQQTTHAFTFAGVAMLMCLIASTLGAASLYVGGFAPAKAIPFIWWTWWLGDMTGVLTVGVFLLTWSRRPSVDWHPRQLAEAALLLLLLSTLACVIFGIVLPITGLPTPLAYLVVPFLVWATFRFGLHGAATALVLASALAVVGTAQGTGPFAQPTVETSLLLLQVFMGVLSVTVLVTAAVLAERQGAEAKARQWESVFNKASWAVAVTDSADNRLKAVNPAFAAMHGFTVEELVGRPLVDLFASESRTELPRHIQIAHQRADYMYESVHVRKDGTSFPCLTHATTLKDAHGKAQFRASTFEDITEKKQNESWLSASLKEKEILLKEIHHRVKNNLQIVSTLLDLQSDHTQDRQALEMFKESRGRVRSMALIHERLYRSPDLARVNFAEYVQQLAQDLYSIYKVSDDDISLHVEVAVSPLPLDMAVPCGLLLNELLSNCLKHGFKDASQGWIRVTLHDEGLNNVLTVADNGIGFPPDFDFRHTTSFGLQLVTTLVEQLKGKIELGNSSGTVVIITFPGHDRSQEEPT